MIYRLIPPPLLLLLLAGDSPREHVARGRGGGRMRGQDEVYDQFIDQPCRRRSGREEHRRTRREEERV